VVAGRDKKKSVGLRDRGNCVVCLLVSTSTCLLLRLKASVRSIEDLCMSIGVMKD
jgi:hypothetical protein